jgi:hypothetical protein
MRVPATTLNTHTRPGEPLERDEREQRGDDRE